MQNEFLSLIVSALTSLVASLSLSVGVLPSHNVASVVGTTTPSGISVVTNDVGLQSLRHNGQEFLAHGAYTAGNLVGSIVFTTPGGVNKNYGWIENAIQQQFHISSGVRTELSNPVGFQHIYRSGLDDSFTVRITYTPVDNRTLQIDTHITNNDQVDSIREINLNPLFLPLRTPGPANQFSGSIPMSVSPTNQWFFSPVAFLNGTWGSIALWMNDYSSNWNKFTYYGNPNQTEFGFYLLNNSSNRRHKYFDQPIGPGQTRRFTTFLRFGTTSDTPESLAPEAFERLRSAFPQISTWSKRGPIARWFIAEGTRRSALNPRGYLWDPNLDVSNDVNFRNRVLTKTDDIIARLNRMDPRPQGILIWDLEGQEFDHAFTYIGYPNKLREIAPEMDKVADEMFAKFRNAGYEAGITIRPQRFGTGTVLPPTCEVRSGDNSARDVFIKTDAPFGARNFVCVSPNTWQVTTAGPGHQTDVNEDNEIYESLRSKISFARNRWGVRIFYIDTTVYTGGHPVDFRIFRRLQQEFPDVVMFVENWTHMYWAGSSTYMHGAFGHRDVPTFVRLLYPNAFSAFQVIDGVNLNDPVVNNTLVESVRRGNILFVDAWYDAPTNPTILKIYRDAGVTSGVQTPLPPPPGLTGVQTPTQTPPPATTQTPPPPPLPPTQPVQTTEPRVQPVQTPVQVVPPRPEVLTNAPPQPVTIPGTSKFRLGDAVHTTRNLSVRNTAGGVRQANFQRAGSSGTVVSGPITTGGFTWWQINYANNQSGWSAENWLQSGTTTLAPAIKFSIGDRVVTTANVNVRISAGGRSIGSQRRGSFGTVVAGPIRAGNHMWWRINYANNLNGWSSENWLEKR